MAWTGFLPVCIRSLRPEHAVGEREHQPQSSRGTPIIAQTTPSGSGAAIGKPVPGLAFFTLSLVSIAQRHSFPIRVEQVVRSNAEKAASKAKAQAKQPLVPRPKRRPGRPPGRTNQTKTPVTLTPELVRIQAMIDALLRLIMPICPLTYLVLDGHFGHHNALHMARQCALHLISKLRCDAALYLPLRRSLCRAWSTSQIWQQGG